MKKLQLFLLLLSFVNITIFAHPGCNNTHEQQTISSFNKYTALRYLGFAALVGGPAIAFSFMKNEKNVYRAVTAGATLFMIGGLVVGSPKIKKWEKEAK